MKAKQHLPLFSILVILSLLGGLYYITNVRSKNKSINDTSAEKILGELTYYPNQTFRGNWIFDGGKIWVATPFNLIQYDYETGDKKIYTERDGLLPNPVGGLFKRGGEIWVASPGYGVSILTINNDEWRYVNTKDGLVSVLNLSMKYEDNVVQFTTFEGVSLYDFKKDKWTSNISQNPPSPFKQTNHSNKEFLDRDFYEGWYWRIINRPAGNRLITTLSGLSENNLPELLVDLDKYGAGCTHGGPVQNVSQVSLHYHDGSVWVGCDQGIIRYDIAKGQTDYIEIIKEAPANITSVHASKGDNLFVETSLGLGIVNPVLQSWTPFIYLGSPVFAEHLVTRTLWQNDTLEYMTIALGDGSQDPNPTWWRYNFKNESFTKVEIPENVVMALEKDGPRAILENYPPSYDWQFNDQHVKRGYINSYDKETHRIRIESSEGEIILVLPEEAPDCCHFWDVALTHTKIFLYGYTSEFKMFEYDQVTKSWNTRPLTGINTNQLPLTLGVLKMFPTSTEIKDYERIFGDRTTVGLKMEKEYYRDGLFFHNTVSNEIYRVSRNQGLHDVYSKIVSDGPTAWLVGRAGLMKINLKEER